MFDALIRRGRRGVAPLAAVAALAPAAAGCAAGADAQTNKPYSAREGIDAAVSSMKLRSTIILGPKPEGRLSPGGTAPMYLTLANNGSAPDRLADVTTDGTFGGQKISGGGVDIAPGQAVRIGEKPAVTLGKLSKPLTGGESVRVTFTFTRAGSLTVNVPVVVRDRYFATYAPAPKPAASKTPRGKHGKPRSSRTPNTVSPSAGR